MELNQNYSALAYNLLENFPYPPNKYTFNYAIQYHRHTIGCDAFNLTVSTEIYQEKILKSEKICKATRIDELSHSWSP